MLDLLMLRQYVKRRLGYSALNIELADEDIDIIVDEGIRLINRHVPGARMTGISATTGQKRYVISHKNLIDIVDVQFMNEQQSLGRISENPFFNQQMYSYDSTTQNEMSDYYLTLSSFEDRNRLYSQDPMWTAGWEYTDTGVREYALYIDLPDDIPGYKISYRYLYSYEISDDQDVGINTLPNDASDWLQRYTLASCRELLGDIRNKYNGVAAPDGFGSTGPVDGESQISRGREDVRILMEDLRKMQKQLPPIIA